MGLFDKKITIFEVKGDKLGYKQMKKTLKDAGIKCSGSIWTDEVGHCGCGAGLDNRNFGAGGRIDRDIYSIRVSEEDVQRAQELVQQTFPAYTPYVPSEDRIRFSG